MLLPTSRSSCHSGSLPEYHEACIIDERGGCGVSCSFLDIEKLSGFVCSTSHIFKVASNCVLRRSEDCGLTVQQVETFFAIVLDQVKVV